MAWIRVAGAVVLYLVVAVGTSLVMRLSGRRIEVMESRTSPRVLAVGAAANLLILVGVLAMLRFVDGRPIADLGLRFGAGDLLFCLAAVGATGAGAAAFMAWMGRSGRLEVRARNPVNEGSVRGLASAVAVLFVVALQEEVLFRGYLTLNLLAYGPVVVLIVTTVVFTAIHFLTNRVTPAQVASWLLGGLLLGIVYLVSGSIWVPVVVHFVTDVTNVLAFAVAGELSFVRLSRPLGDAERAAFRAGHVAAVIVLLAGFYRVAPTTWGPRMTVFNGSVARCAPSSDV